MSDDWAANVPVIEDWVTLRAVAERLNVTRQQAHLLATQGRFKTLRRLDAEGRPAYVLRRAELEDFATWRALQPGAKRGPNPYNKHTTGPASHRPYLDSLGDPIEVSCSSMLSLDATRILGKSDEGGVPCPDLAAWRVVFRGEALGECDHAQIACTECSEEMFLCDDCCDSAIHAFSPTDVDATPMTAADFHDILAPIEDRGNMINVDFDRVCQLNALAATNANPPEGLTPDEMAVWRNAKDFLEMAEKKGLTVHIPSN